MKKTIDFHCHPVTDAFRQSMHDLTIDVPDVDGFPLPAWSIESHLSFMKQAHIDFSLLSSPTPHAYNGDGAKASIAARAINEAMADIVKAYPDQFGFAASLPLPDVAAAINEARYAYEHLGAMAIKLTTNSYGVYLGDPQFTPLMQYLNERHALVIVHPTRAMERPKDCITGSIAAIYEYPVDTTRALLNMIAHRIMTTYPHITWVIPHVGSFLPYMKQRFTGISAVLSQMGMMEQVDVNAECSNLYFDIAGDPEPLQLPILRMMTDDAHILYGSDFPHSPAPAILAKKAHFDENTQYDDVRKKIYYENGLNLLK